MNAKKGAVIGACSLAAFLGALVLAPAGALAMQVERAVVCENVVDREPVNPATQFAATVGKLYCLTHVRGAAAPTRITHVWYYGEVERARVDLAVGASSWRTYSSKMIRPVEIGSWKVEILDADGNTLDSVNFEIVQP